MPRPNRGPYLRFRRDRGSFYICWSETGITRQRSVGTKDSGEAQAALANFIRERQRGKQSIGPRDPSEFPISDALALYGEEHAPTVTAPERIGYALAALLPFWGDSMASHITQATCRAYGKERKVSDGTLRKELGVLRAAINYAHRHGRITHTPFVFLPEKPSGRDRWLTRHEAARLLNAARTARGDVRLYLPLFIVLGLYTGARKDAILSLRWPQIDFEQGRIDFNQPGRKRTSKGRPIIPIPDHLLTFLRLARRRGSDLGYVVHRNGTRIADIGDGKSGSFGSACKRAGISDVTPHTLRHTCGTWMAQKGVDLWQVSGWLGQSHARTTELYAHHHPDFMADAKRAADRR